MAIRISDFIKDAVSELSPFSVLRATQSRTLRTTGTLKIPVGSISCYFKFYFYAVATL